MTTTDAPNRPIQASMKTFDIIETLVELDGAGVVELADRVGLAPSTVHDHLATLASRGLVVKENSEYHVGLKFLEYGIHARNRLPFIDIAQPELRKLAKETGEIAWLYTEEYGRGVVVHKETGENALETVGHFGWRPYLHCTAAGKAILAHMSEEEVDSIIELHGLPTHTEQTISNREELHAELETIRKEGFSVNGEEQNNGIAAVGVPLLHNGEVLGAVSISGPTHRISGEYSWNELASHIKNLTEQIELKLRYR